MKKLIKIPNSCAVVALHLVSGVNEMKALRICELCGFKPSKGMEDKEWKEAAKKMGIEIRSFSLEPMRLRKFIKKYPNATYLVGTFDHLFVVDKGNILDPRCTKPPGLDRLIKQAWLVK